MTATPWTSTREETIRRIFEAQPRVRLRASEVLRIVLRERETNRYKLFDYANTNVARDSVRRMLRKLAARGVLVEVEEGIFKHGGAKNAGGQRI